MARKHSRRISQFVVTCMVAKAVLFPSPAAESSDAFFESKIRPVLAEHCYKCHSHKAGKTKGGLAFDSREDFLAGGETGTAFIPNKPDESLILRALRYTDEALQMPPDDPLPPEIIAHFETWIRSGASLPEAWSAAEFGLDPWWENVSKEDLLPRTTRVPEAIDHYIDAKLRTDQVAPAPKADPYELGRRVTLDLAGRIPTAAEARAFADCSSGEAFAAKIGELISSSEFIEQQAVELNWLLTEGRSRDFEIYLKRSLREERGWDTVFQQVIDAAPSGESAQGAAEFLKGGANDLDRLANDVSVRFFGVNISCAQCHDHPLVPSWKQDHYYGMKAFFSRTFINGEFVGERAYGEIDFTTVSGDKKKAAPMFLTGAALVEPESPPLDNAAKKAEKELLEELKKKNEPPPPPGYSRRNQLVAIALEPGSREFLARAIVNRTWHQYFGHGLVTPLDQLHGQNKPSHPELLEWLARDFIENGYDARRLIGGIVLSEAYQRGSHYGGAERPHPSYFAVAVPRALTPQQLAKSLLVAVSLPAKPESTNAVIDELTQGAAAWLKEFERPAHDFQMSAAEALFFSNSQRVENELLGGDGKLASQIARAAPDEAVDMAVWNVLSRPASADEREWLTGYLKERSERADEAARQMIWALITSAEFRFNH